ncbi:MAG: hypothetical protein A2845_04230 [Candidatus Lloydbacteria bacterium RIFCSPHIGHO2_01_FULL_49_22]|uniref:DUF2207 domain-containing protein n=1 Tax=Candidatus Lloydbacteria bacterium RIFCSPHIGHO2_01_FULL_49_22 TaxID=1798658 RepID=A0A1G2CWQ5_9BACT|nr:MAG: hypothetical protein A2845_04230 [Candidatus Lloydbacteria bacterium RIFCSPHIGHO2_01_FULL_49_22]OGZ08863.1 MAG: hypothetical protein A3C14_01265 [Candidatus Lloydbacteria bacterium RIFCSPHIGHO2_02_FULL_50_18]
MTDHRFLRLVCAAFFFLTPFFAFADDSIDAFTAHIELKPNGSAVVQEEIVYSFNPDGEVRHGIYRRIPLTFTVPGERAARSIEISSIMVTDGKGNLRESKYSGGGNYMELKIGDPDVEVTGRQLYVIHYTVWGAINQGLAGKDEFYWNVTGNEWKQTIAAVRTDVILPLPLNENSISSACYVGPLGSTALCTASSTPQEGTGIINSVRFTYDGSLHSNEGMTVAVGIPKGIFLIAPKSSVKKLADSVGFYRWWKNDFLGMSALIPLVVFVVMWNIWWKKGRDPKGRGTIIAQYDIPKHLTTLELGYLYHSDLKPKTISAAIIDFAVRGLLTIERTKKKRLLVTNEDHRLHFLPGVDTSLLTAPEKMLYDTLRASGETVLVSTLAHKFVDVRSELSKLIAVDLTSLGYFETDPQVTTRNYVLTGIALIVIGSLLSFGNLALIVSGVIVTVFGYFMGKRTQQGAIAREEIEGFKEYLSVAEKDRIDFANAPEKEPKTFERFLPYAMIFGVEKAWAEKFVDMYTKKDAERWYQGGGVRFNAAALAASMGAFSTSAGTAFASAGGGSGGGGMSGGGGGGGGGGSW